MIGSGILRSSHQTECDPRGCPYFCAYSASASRVRQSWMSRSCGKILRGSPLASFFFGSVISSGSCQRASAGRLASGITSSSVNGYRISGLVGNASRYRLPPPPPPPAPNPRGTANPDAVNANMPAPPALSLSMSLRVTRLLFGLAIILLDSPSSVHAPPRRRWIDNAGGRVAKHQDESRVGRALAG